MQILGEEYALLLRTEEEDPKLKSNYGYTDWTNKTIVLLKEIQEDGDSLCDIVAFRKKVLRHEIIHAFFSESGLMENSDFATNEELVDWIAVQIPKMIKVMEAERAL